MAISKARHSSTQMMLQLELPWAGQHDAEAGKLVEILLEVEFSRFQPEYHNSSAQLHSVPTWTNNLQLKCTASWVRAQLGH